VDGFDELAQFGLKNRPAATADRANPPVQVSLTPLADTKVGRCFIKISLSDGCAADKARRTSRLVCAAVIAAALTLGCAAQAARAGGDPASSGLPVPRFVSLKADRVTVRGGPDKDHDVAWIYTRVGWPVEITAEFENWRRIRDSDGSEGWVYHSLLSGKRMAAVQMKSKTDLAPLYAKPDAKSAVTAQLQVGVLGAVKQCTGAWCQISGDNFEGWIEQTELWGVYPDEKIE
jgi:SH3-like domain-containing protein